MFLIFVPCSEINLLYEIFQQLVLILKYNILSFDYRIMLLISRCFPQCFFTRADGLSNEKKDLITQFGFRGLLEFVSH